MEIDNSAPVITRDAIEIAAPVATVWSLLTAIPAWPEWNRDITSAQIDGPLAVGSTFVWHTAGMEIASTVADYVPLERIAWSGEVQGILGLHVWRFVPTIAGVRVETDESWSGEPVAAQASALQPLLDASLRSWLESLKQQAESPV